jgi:hypothetical protein
MEPLEREEHEIRQYVLSQSPRREKVTHAEKVTTRNLYGTGYDIWDVWTLKDRWWVITRPTNLYSQTDFVSMEVAFTYHLGLGVVLSHRNAPPVEDDEVVRIAGPWRRWQEAADELNEAVEAEDFQSIGVRCREALLALVRELANPAMAPKGDVAPKADDFIHWSELIAGHVVRGPSLEDVRSHLKTVAKTTWGLARWLDHTTNATRADSRIAVEATSHTLSVFVTAVLSAERAERVRCPVCGSYRVMAEYDPETRQPTGRALRCDACGFGQAEKPSKPQKPARPLRAERA